MPYYNPSQKSIQNIDVFYGYNNNLRVADGEFYNMQNLTSSYFPLLSTRHKRATTLVEGNDLQCIFGKRKFGYINDQKLYYGGAVVDGLEFPNIDRERQVVSLGAYLLIFPDNIYVNTHDLTEYGSMSASFTTDNAVEFSLCDADGTGYEDYSVSETAPPDPSDGDLWLDSKNNSLKRFSAYSSAWVGITSTYVKITHPSIGESFKQYDGVMISGADDSQFNTTTVLWAASDDYVIVTGLIDAAYTQTDPLTLAREIPDMEFFCEGENRVWGCNSEKNEIYACKLGDFKNWNCFMGLSTDSYAVSVGTDGDFTGAVRYLSSILFFKENYVHKIYNTNPPYNVSTTSINGVMKDAHKTLCVVNGRLYYLSPTGVCSYEGATATLLDNVFGVEYYHSGAGGEYRGKYYICLSASVPFIVRWVEIPSIFGLPILLPVFELRTFGALFVYDTKRDMWHKEALNAAQFASYDNNLYFIEEDAITKARTLGMIDAKMAYGDFKAGVTGYDIEKYFDWFAETGLLGLDYAGQKYIKVVTVRLKLTATDVQDYPAFVKLYAEYDSSGTWVLLDEIKAQNTHGYTIKAAIPQRCDHIRLKIEGRGECLIYSITLETEKGSELGG